MSTANLIAEYIINGIQNLCEVYSHEFPSYSMNIDGRIVFYFLNFDIVCLYIHPEYVLCEAQTEKGGIRWFSKTFELHDTFTACTHIERLLLDIKRWLSSKEEGVK